MFYAYLALALASTAVPFSFPFSFSFSLATTAARRLSCRPMLGTPEQQDPTNEERG